MFCTYILFSEKCGRYYIGHCEDIEARLTRHNNGFVTATRNCYSYQLKASKAFSSREEAQQEEMRLKKKKSRKYLEWLIQGNW